MAQVYEKRKDFRYRINSQLVFQVNLAGTNYPAKKLNHSSTGISFKSNHGLKPGTFIYIRRESCPPDCPGGKMCEGCRMVTFATVKWCSQIENASTASYLTGAKYY